MYSARTLTSYNGCSGKTENADSWASDVKKVQILGRCLRIIESHGRSDERLFSCKDNVGIRLIKEDGTTVPVKLTIEK